MPVRGSTFEAIGTRWDIRADSMVTDATWRQAMDQIQGCIQAFDTAYSRFRTDSLVSQMAERAGRYELPSDGYKMLQFYERLYNATAGKVTPLIGQTMEGAGYDAVYSFKQSALKKPPRWEDVLSYTEGDITVKQPVLLDFGAAGKGYLVDLVSDITEKQGITDYTINAGGDILHRSSSGALLEVGLENPRDTSEAIALMQLGNLSLCASAGSKRAWGDFHHIIDPFALTSPAEIMATWVLAEDTMTADGLATALFFTPPEALAKQYKFSYALLRQDMSLQYARDFPITLFEVEKQ